MSILEALRGGAVQNSQIKKISWPKAIA